MIYLAGPYTHANSEVREWRAAALTACAVNLARQGMIVYSPITSWHRAAINYNLPVEHEFWARQNFGMLRHATALYILMLDGWELSRGVAAETQMAHNLFIPIKYLKWEDQI